MPDYLPTYDPKLNKPEGGRPLFDGKPYHEVISKLEYVWAMRGTDTQAAAFADISRVTLWRLLKSRPDVLKRKERLLQLPVLKALKTVNDSLEDPDHAKWFLERVMPNEFGLKNKEQPSSGPTVNIFGDVKIQQIVSQFEEQFKQALMTKQHPKYVEAQSISTIQETNMQQVASAGVPDAIGEIPGSTLAAGGGDNSGSGSNGQLSQTPQGKYETEAVDEPGEEPNIAEEMAFAETVRVAKDTKTPADKLVVSQVSQETGD
jgi:hypothetical protein